MTEFLSLKVIYRTGINLLALVCLATVSACTQAVLTPGQGTPTAASPLPAGSGAQGKSGTYALVGHSGDGLRVVDRLPPPTYIAQGRSQTIFVNDLLKIDFFDVSDLNKTVRVTTSGTITLPLIGEVKAAGRTAEELQAELKRLYGRKYLQNPEINVFVRDSKFQKLTMDGEVRRPGTFAMGSKSSLLRLLAQAGGLSDIANDASIFIYRTFEQETLVAAYSVADIRAGRRLDPQLYAGDVAVAFPSNRKVALRNLKEALGIAGSAARVAATPL